MNKEEFEEHIKQLANRKFTYEDVKAYWDEQVKREENHWGKDYIYSQWERDAREKALNDFQEGKAVEVYKEYDHFGYGTWGEDATAYIYSDGTFKIHYYSAD